MPTSVPNHAVEAKAAAEADRKDKSLGLLSQSNGCRKLFRKLAEAKWFDYLIYVLIVVSSIQLTLENPLLDPRGWESTYLRHVDIGITFLFTFEVVVKVVSYGLVQNGEQSYLKSAWNRLDFAIVIVSIISLAMPVEASESLTTFKVIRMARLLRPIRVISRNEGLRVSI